MIKDAADCIGPSPPREAMPAVYESAHYRP